MRGLDARVAYATAKVQCLIDEAIGEDRTYVALLDANNVGYWDHRAGCLDMPLMFNGEPHLHAAWKDGQCRAAEEDEMGSCEHCSSDSHDPCPSHG